MPHVVLQGPTTLEDIWLAFNPTDFREDDVTFKAQECFLSESKETMLIRSLVVERNFPKNFFVKLTQREGEITIGLEKLATPERTDAVKRLLGLFAWKIMQVDPEMSVLKTNIEETIGAPKSA
ncbi:hypothetical protein KQI84_19025 [bacterium]|nr:hypothetical protein [bacterium]